MKKFLLSMLAVATLSVSAFAQTTTETFLQSKLVGDDEGYTSTSGSMMSPNIDSFTSDKLDITCGGGSKFFALYTSDIRIFPGNQMTVTPKADLDIVLTNITFNYKDKVGTDNAKPLSGIYYTKGSGAAHDMEFKTDGSVYSWTMNPSDMIDKIIITGPESGQARIIAFSISYAPIPEASDVEKPVISGTNPFDESTTVTISGSGEIFYTLDGIDPTMESDEYREPFTISESTVVKAINVVSGKASDVVTMEFFKNFTGPQKPVVLVDGENALTDVINLGTGESAEISFRDPAEGVNIYYNLFTIGDAAAGEDKLYEEPFEVRKTSVITYYAEENGKRSESGKLTVNIAEPPHIEDGVPEGMSLLPVPGDNFRASDFKDGIKIEFDAASYIMYAEKGYAEITNPDNQTVKRFISKDGLSGNDAYIDVKPSFFAKTGVYTFVIYPMDMDIHNTGGELLEYPAFRVTYTITDNSGSGGPGEGVPAELEITPAPGNYETFPSDHITMVAKDYYAFFTTDNMSIATITYPDGSTEPIEAIWSQEVLNSITFPIPAGTMDKPGKYTFNINFSKTMIFKDQQGNEAKIEPFYFVYNIGDVAIEGIDAEEADAVYYDLNGRRVNGTPDAGIYIRVAGGKTTKVIRK